MSGKEHQTSIVKHSASCVKLQAQSKHASSDKRPATSVQRQASSVRHLAMSVKRQVSSEEGLEPCPEFSIRVRLTRHQAVHTDHRPFECGICHSTFKCKKNLIRHSETRHPNEEIRIIEEDDSSDDEEFSDSEYSSDSSIHFNLVS